MDNKPKCFGSHPDDANANDADCKGCTVRQMCGGFDEQRADVIGQNGNDGEHYAAAPPRPGLQEELGALAQEMRGYAMASENTGLPLYPRDAIAWADRIAAIREGLGKAQGEAVATDDMIDAACAVVPDLFRVDAMRAIEAAIPICLQRIQELESDYGDVAAENEDLKRRIQTDNSAQALVEALEKDAARYRKLRSSNWYIGPMPSCAAYSAGNRFDDRNTSRQELDAAVDALSAHKSEVKG